MLHFSRLAIVVLLTLGAASCGDDDDTSATTAPTGIGQEQRDGIPETTPPEGELDKGRVADGQEKFSDTSASFAPKSHDDSGGGSQHLRVKGADNSVQGFGAETRGSEFEQAAAVLHGFLDARAQGAWAAACSYLSSETRRRLEREVAAAGGIGKCARLVAATSAGIPGVLRDEAAAADVGSLRAEGDRGFLVYRGAENIIFAIAVSKEDGDWRLAGLMGLPLN